MFEFFFILVECIMKKLSNYLHFSLIKTSYAKRSIKVYNYSTIITDIFGWYCSKYTFARYNAKIGKNKMI